MTNLHRGAECIATTCALDDLEFHFNASHFRELLGLTDHTPFECVGSAAEARLALALARARGALGPKLSALAAACGSLDVPPSPPVRRRRP